MILGSVFSNWSWGYQQSSRMRGQSGAIAQLGFLGYFSRLRRSFIISGCYCPRPIMKSTELMNLIWCQRNELPTQQKQYISFRLSPSSNSSFKLAFIMSAEKIVLSKFTVLVTLILQKLIKLWVPQKSFMDFFMSSMFRLFLAKKYLYLLFVHQYLALKSGVTCWHPMILMSYGKIAFIMLQQFILASRFSLLLPFQMSVRRFRQITLPIAETPLSVLPALVKESSAGKHLEIKLRAFKALKIYYSTLLSDSAWQAIPSQLCPKQHTFRANFLTSNLSNNFASFSQLDPLSTFCLKGSWSASLFLSLLFYCSRA